MMSNEFNNRYQEENAKAEQIGAAIAVGCFGIPLVLLVLVLMVVAFVG
jgi:hypothetical protein